MRDEIVGLSCYSQAKNRHRASELVMQNVSLNMQEIVANETENMSSRLIISQRSQKFM
jgi:hypothetical protein